MDGAAATVSLNSTILAVSGMTCGSCARSVERALSRVPGVERASVDAGQGTAMVQGSASAADLIAAVEAAGYGASVADENTFQEKRHEHRGCCC